MWQITGTNAAELFHTGGKSAGWAAESQFWQMYCKCNRKQAGSQLHTTASQNNPPRYKDCQSIVEISLFFSGFISHTSTRALRSFCVTSFYRKPLLMTWSGSHSVDRWAGRLFNLTSSPSFGRRWRHAAAWRKNTLAHAYWRYAGPFLCFHFWPLFFLSPQENTESGGCRAATSAVPPSPPHLISVVQSFETSVSRRTKEWWSMCNKCQCHGNPRFPPKIFLFIPFEDLSPGRAGITRPQAKPWQSLFSACSLID